MGESSAGHRMLQRLCAVMIENFSGPEVTEGPLRLLDRVDISLMTDMFS